MSDATSLLTKVRAGFFVALTSVVVAAIFFLILWFYLYTRTIDEGISVDPAKAGSEARMATMFLGGFLGAYLVGFLAYSPKAPEGIVVAPAPRPRTAVVLVVSTSIFYLVGRNVLDYFYLFTSDRGGLLLGLVLGIVAGILVLTVVAKQMPDNFPDFVKLADQKEDDTS